MLPAALITKSAVYALELSREMLHIISEKAQAAGLNHIVPVEVQGDDFGVPDGTVDMILLATVLHEIPDKSAFLSAQKNAQQQREDCRYRFPQASNQLWATG